MAPTKPQLLGAQRFWKSAGIYSGAEDGTWGRLSIAADAKVPWAKALQTYLQSRGWYRGKIDGDPGPLTLAGVAKFEDELLDVDQAKTPTPINSKNFEDLRDEYSALWASAIVTDHSRFNPYLAKAEINRLRYEAVSRELGGNVPWQLIAGLHMRESSMRFNGHLHNGDSLKARTHNVPAGRPAAGSPPFTWEESALDALKIKGLDKIKAWPIERILYEGERYNGFGYRQYRGIQSAYLWAGTNHYAAGKYVSDGVWSKTAVDTQPGVAGLLKLLGVA